MVGIKIKIRGGNYDELRDEIFEFRQPIYSFDTQEFAIADGGAAFKDLPKMRPLPKPDNTNIGHFLISDGEKYVLTPASLNETDPIFTQWLNTNPFNGYATENWVQNQGYLTSFTETDPTVASHIKNITSTQISNWDTAFGWGNHASAGYAILPTQTGNAGKYLQTDGNNLSWQSVSANPGGGNTTIQFNDNNIFNGDSNFTWNNTQKRLTTGINGTNGGITIRGTFNPLVITNGVTSFSYIWSGNNSIFRPSGNNTTSFQDYLSQTVLSYTSNLLAIQKNTKIGGTIASPNAMLEVIGEGTTDSTFGLQIHNSTGNNNALVVRDDGFIGVNTNAPLLSLPIGGTIESFSVGIPTVANAGLNINDRGIAYRRDVNGLVWLDYSNQNASGSSAVVIRMSNNTTQASATIAKTGNLYSPNQFGNEPQSLVFLNKAPSNNRMKFSLLSTDAASNSYFDWLTGDTGGGALPSDSNVNGGVSQTFSIMRLMGNGNLLLGTTSNSARLTVVGSDTTSSTFGLKIHNSTGTNNALSVRDDGRVDISSGRLHVGDGNIEGRIWFGNASAPATTTNGFIDIQGVSSSAGSVINIPGTDTNNETTRLAMIHRGRIDGFRFYPAVTGGSSDNVGKSVFGKSTGGAQTFGVDFRFYGNTNSLTLGTNEAWRFYSMDAINPSTTNLLRFQIGNGALVTPSVFVNSCLGITNNSSITVDNNALLDLQSTTKGFLPPRMTSAQRDLISSPATGLTLYNTSTNTLDIRSSSNIWNKFGSETVIIGNGTTSSTFGLQVYNSTGTNNALVVRDDGRVGIGTNSPNSQLHIQGAFPSKVGLIINGTNLSTNNGSLAVWQNNGADRGYIYVADVGSDALRGIKISNPTAQSEIMVGTAYRGVTITNNGSFTNSNAFQTAVTNILGTTTPLTVFGANVSASTLGSIINHIHNTNTVGRQIQLLHRFFTSTGVVAEYGGYGTELMVNTNGAHSGDLFFRTALSGTYAERMRLKSSGSLLIGTTTEAVSSILTLESTSKGFLPPRMTTAQWNAISSKAQGLFGFDITQQKPILVTQNNGINETIDTTIFTQTTTQVVSNTTAETTIFGSGVGTLSLPANFLTPGKTISIKNFGFMNETGTPTLRLRVKLGSTVLYDSTAVNINSLGGTNKFYECIFDITCRTIGNSGTVFTQGKLEYTSNSGQTYILNGANTSEVIVDTTISHTLDITIEWGAANADNNLHSTNTTIKINN